VIFSQERLPQCTPAASALHEQNQRMRGLRRGTRSNKKKEERKKKEGEERERVARRGSNGCSSGRPR